MRKRISKTFFAKYSIILLSIALVTMSFTGHTTLQAPITKTDYSGISKKYGKESNGKIHYGIDLVSKTGVKVMAVATGKVIEASSNKMDGNRIVIEHENGFQSIYTHLNAINVQKGSGVSAGDCIGTVGTTGHSTGAHLHLEIKLNGKHVDPLEYIQL